MMGAASQQHDARSRRLGPSLWRVGTALLAAVLGVGCSHYSAPERGAALVLYEGRGGVSLPPLPPLWDSENWGSDARGSGSGDAGVDSGNAGSGSDDGAAADGGSGRGSGDAGLDVAAQGQWRFSRRGKQSLTYLHVGGERARSSHKLFVTLFDTPTDAWSRLPAQVLFAEMISTSKVLLIDVLPDARQGDGPTIKRGLLTLVRPGDRDPTVLAVACALPPDSERVVCGMLEETKPAARPPPTTQSELQTRMLPHAEFLTAWLGQARGVHERGS